MFWSPWWASLERDKTFDVLLQDALDRFMTLMTAVIIVKLVVHTTHSTSWYFRSFDRILTDNERQANFKTFHQTDENISKLLFSSSFEEFHSHLGNFVQRIWKTKNYYHCLLHISFCLACFNFSGGIFKMISESSRIPIGILTEKEFIG
jgi:hypothetical protein